MLKTSFVVSSPTDKIRNDGSCSRRLLISGHCRAVNRQRLTAPFGLWWPVAEAPQHCSPHRITLTIQGRDRCTGIVRNMVNNAGRPYRLPIHTQYMQSIREGIVGVAGRTTSVKPLRRPLWGAFILAVQIGFRLTGQNAQISASRSRNHIHNVRRQCFGRTADFAAGNR